MQNASFSLPATAADGAAACGRIVAAFAEAAARTKEVFAVLEGNAFAVLPSQRQPDSSLVLLWSHEPEASRWADVLAVKPTVVALDLVTLTTTALPAIAKTGGLIGPDWGADPIEPEHAPADLDALLRTALVKDFAHLVSRNRCVWTLLDSDGVAGLDDGGGEVVPVWGDRHTAEGVARHCGRGLEAQRMPLMDFTSRFLLTARALKARIAPAYLPGPGAPAVTPWQFKALLTGGLRHVQGL